MMLVRCRTGPRSPVKVRSYIIHYICIDTQYMHARGLSGVSCLPKKYMMCFVKTIFRVLSATSHHACLGTHEFFPPSTNELSCNNKIHSIHSSTDAINLTLHYTPDRSKAKSPGLHQAHRNSSGGMNESPRSSSIRSIRSISIRFPSPPQRKYIYHTSLRTNNTPVLEKRNRQPFSPAVECNIQPLHSASQLTWLEHSFRGTNEQKWKTKCF